MPPTWLFACANQMNKEDLSQSQDTGRPLSWRTLRRILIGGAGLATLVAFFYSVENWRGKRAWVKCKRDLEAKGAVLDWAAYIPPAVPDRENVFKAPGITESFVKLGSSFCSLEGASEVRRVLADLSALNQARA